MDKPIRYLGQAVMYALFFLPLAYFSHAPSHRYVEEGMAVLKVAVRHAGEVIGECTSITGESHGPPGALTTATGVDCGWRDTIQCPGATLGPA